MKINILLPHKEKFDLYKASSVSLTVKNNMYFSKFKKNILVYGQKVKNPIYPENFFGIEDPKLFFKSKNKNIANKMYKNIKNANQPNQLIEIHNRPYLVNYLFKKIKNIPIILFFHNDPQTMQGSKTIEERINILSKVKLILCVSKFIKYKFLEGINENQEKVNVLYNGVNRLAKVLPSKKKEILFLGRIVPEKGVHLYVKAISMIAKEFPDWKFYICGSTHLGSNKLNSNFSREIINQFNNIGNQTTYTGFLDHDQVQNRMQRASIIVVPSVWEEPYGLVVSEAMSNGIAVIASHIGGIPEIIKKNGILIDDIDEFKIYKKISYLIQNPNILSNFQNLAWDNFKHTSQKSSKKLDFFRTQFLIF